jgi:hypothetical protein
LDVDESWGTFDFIICHGVYSWVPRTVQDKILEIAAQQMRPAGLCYVSYNTFPGWHLRAVVRDMMRYHVARFEDAATKIEQARALLAFLGQKCVSEKEAYSKLLADEADILSRCGDSYLFHEHLEEVNEPLYFHEFIARADKAGLGYLGDTEFRSMLTENFDAETSALLRGVPLVEQEQYMDFLRNRTFRASVLCHANVQLDLHVSPQRFTACSVMLKERLATDHVIEPSEEPLRLTMENSSVTLSHPVTKMALAGLNAAWPGFMAFDELLKRAVADAGGSGSGGVQGVPTDEQRSILARDLMTLWLRGLVRASIDPPVLANQPSRHPSVTPLVRAQARHGGLVVNRHHKSVRLDDLTRSLLTRLDGEQSRESLVAWLSDAFGRGEFRVVRGETPITEFDDTMVSEILDGALRLAADHALLVR